MKASIRGCYVILALLIQVMCAFTYADIVNLNDSEITIELNKTEKGQKTSDSYQYIIDNEKEHDINTLSTTPSLWQQPEPGVTNRGFSVVNSWMRFNLHNSQPELFETILEYVDPAAASIDLYHRDLGSSQEFERLEFVYNKPAAERPFAFYRPAFPIAIAPGETKEIIVRIYAGEEFPMHSFTALRIWEKNSFNRSTQKELSLLIILLCTEILMGLASLVLFYLNRDTIFLYYSFFVFSAASLFASFSGIWPYFISPDRYELWMVVLQISICQIAALLFVRKFLNTKKHLPIVDKVLLLVIAIDVIGVILNLLGSPYLSRIIIDFTAIGYFFLIPVGIMSQRKGVPQANLFTASWLVFVIGMAFASMRLRGYVPDSSFAEWAIYFGGFIEIFLLASVMVLYIRRLQKEKTLAQDLYKKNLEQTADKLYLKVEEQTRLLKEAKERAEYEARVDILTGLSNRRAFIEEAQNAMARARREINTELYLILFDLDHFKKVNDHYGHAAGDYLLTWTAKTVTGVLREVDNFARIGGEEFAILTVNENLDSTIEIADRIRKSIQDMLVRFQSQEIKITASLGVAKFIRNTTLDELMQSADQALYKAKSSGRNCIAVEQ